MTAGAESSERDQAWLERLLEAIWRDHFYNIERTAPLKIKFGKKARTRLGSLSFDNSSQSAVIRLTRLFQDDAIPAMVVKATIVHELCHYTHGFNTGTTPQYDHPHRGGVIKQEFAQRGLEELYVAQKRWLKANWPRIVRKHYPNLQIAHRRRLYRYKIG